MQTKIQSSISIVTLGTDFEFWMTDNKTGDMIPAEKIISFDDKKNSTGSSIHPDGYQMEGSTYYSTCRQSINDWVHNVLFSNHLQGYGIDLSPVKSIDMSVWDQLNPKTIEFGCQPSYNAWTNTVCPVPNFLQANRCIGAHIHIGDISYSSRGYLEDLRIGTGDLKEGYMFNLYKMCLTFHNRIQQIEEKNVLIKLLDVMVGIPSVIIAEDYEQEALRRTLYGQAGSFRPKDYGVEYRVLSSFFIRSILLITGILGLVRSAVSIFALNKEKEILDLFSEEEIRLCIDMADFDRAKDIISRMDSKFLKYASESCFIGCNSLSSIVSLLRDINRESKLFDVRKSFTNSLNKRLHRLNSNKGIE